MTAFLQWTSILGAGAALAAYGFFRDHLEIKRAMREEKQRRTRQPQQLESNEEKRDNERILTVH